MIRNKQYPQNAPYTPTSEAVTNSGGLLRKIDSPYQPDEGLRVYHTASLDIDHTSVRQKEDHDEEEEHHPLLHHNAGGGIASYQNPHHGNHPTLPPGHLPGYYYPPQPLNPQHPIHQNPYQYFHTATVDLSHQAHPHHPHAHAHAPVELLTMPPPPTGDHS